VARRAKETDCKGAALTRLDYEKLRLAAKALAEAKADREWFAKQSARKQSKPKKRSGLRGPQKRRLVIALAEQQGNLCALCEQPFTESHPPTIDHKQPLMHGGTDRIANLQAAHGWCNRRRGAMSIWMFRRMLANGRIEPPPSEES